MQRKAMVFSILAVASLMFVIAASAITVFALTGTDAVHPAEATGVDEVLEAAPVQAEVSPKVVEPALNVDYASYEGGCPYSHSVKQQLTQAPVQTPAEDAPLAQVVQ